MFGITDGKAVGTYLELKFRKYFINRAYVFEQGNTANGLDFPGLGIDMKVTSIKQPQSSCPFRSIRQKVYGLGYSLIVFVYDKFDDPRTRTAILRVTDTVFVDAAYTADYQLTFGIRDIISKNGNQDDLMAFMMDRNVTADEVELNNLAAEVLSNVPQLGYLTISPAFQWRLQYKRIITLAGKAAGVHLIHKDSLGV